MLLSDIHLWHIYLDQNCEHTNPPKPKYVVVAAIEGETIYGFLFNSNMPKFVTSTPGLLVCEVSIEPEYRFLHKRSYVDCTRLYEFRAKHFSEGYGLLRQDDLVAFILAVRDCPRLTPKDKRLVLKTVKRIIDNDGKE